MSRKVLVVDDEKLIVKGIRFSLEQDGMEVDSLHTGIFRNRGAYASCNEPVFGSASGSDAAEDGRAGSMPADP